MVIARVGRLFKMEDSGWHGEAIDWIGEAMEAIGYHTAFVLKSTELEVCNHRTEYPCDLIRLKHIMYNGSRLLLGADMTKGLYIRDTTEMAELQELTDHEYNELTALYSRLESKQAELDADPDNSELELDIEDIQSQITVLTTKRKLPQGSMEHITLPYYNLNGRFINTSFESGNIYPYYRAYPTDENGYPMIVDSYKYREACFWYLTKMLLLQGHPVSKELNWERAEAMWEKFRSKAAAEGIDTSADKLEGLLNMMHSIKRGLHAVDTFRFNTEQRQGSEI